MKIDFKALVRKLRILPVLIVVASFGFVVRLGDTYVSLKTMSGSAQAEEVQATDGAVNATKVEETRTDTATKPVEEGATTEEAAKAENPVSDTKSEETITPEVADTEAPPAEDLKSGIEDSSADTKKEDDKSVDLPSIEPTQPVEKKWQDAADTDLEDSQIKKEVYLDLVKRRQEVADKEKKLSEREALLEAAQKELDKKMAEMEGLRDELRNLLKQQTADEASRIQSLVKIYSGMKPKDAARIFNTLDTDILMDVISNMPESKSGAIIALMDADRAKALTTLLAEQKKLPEVP